MAQDAEWTISDGLTPYPDALQHMQARAAAIAAGTAAEQIWLLEHPPLYTAGTSANPADLLDPDRFPVYDAGRGGEYTYHGPGQRVGYVMLDLGQRGKDVRRFVWHVEDVMIQTCAAFGIQAERRADRVGVWVVRADGSEDKIGAIGVRVRRWVSFHGFALNVHPDLSHFGGIVPCGIQQHGVTSLHALGVTASMADVDRAIKASFDRIFGLTPRAMPPMPAGLDGRQTATETPLDPIAAAHPVFQL